MIFHLQADIETLKSQCQRLQNEKEKNDKQQVCDQDILSRSTSNEQRYYFIKLFLPS